MTGENGGIVQPDSQAISSDSPTRMEDNATFSGGHGSYAIEIASQKADYTITVEECGPSPPC